MRYIMLIMLLIFNAVMAKYPDKHGSNKTVSQVIYKSTSDQLAICDFNKDVLSGCAYTAFPNNLMYAVHNDHIYIHDMNSNNYQLCKIKGKKIVDCTVTLIDSFKANKIIAVNSRLYMLGRTIRSCSIGSNHNIGKCMDETVFPSDSAESGAFYEGIELVPSEKKGVLLTRKAAGSSKKIGCEIKNSKISSCRNTEDGHYKVIPGEDQYIYKFEPALKQLMICVYDVNSYSVSNCLPTISDFDIVAENMEFTSDNKNALITDSQKNSFVYCNINSEDYKFSKCMHLEASRQPAGIAVIFNEGKPSTPLINREIQDGLTFSEVDGGSFVSCNSTVNKNFLCHKYNGKLFSGLSTLFIKDYLPGHSATSQYAYLLDMAGIELTECSFSPDRITSGAFSHCKSRKDINLPVKIVAGKVWAAAHMLFLLDRNSTVYQCGYDRKNRLKNCENIGMRNLEATGISFDSAHQKVYFYSHKTGRLNACNLFDQRIGDCFAVSTDESIIRDDIRETLISPDSSSILFSGRSVIHHCTIDREVPRLKNCISLSDNFFNISSIAYSKVNPQLLYVLDNNIMKSCYINSGEMRCDRTDLGNSFPKAVVNKFFLSASYLRAGINLIPVTIKNSGGYTLKTTYTTLKKDKVFDKTVNRLSIGQSKDIHVMAGSPVELNAISGNTKCFVINEPGSITCRRSISNVACYYNADSGKSKKIIHGHCPDNLLAHSCTKELFKYVKSSGNASIYCKDWHINRWERAIKAHCTQQSEYRRIICNKAQKAMDAGMHINYNFGILVAENH